MQSYDAVYNTVKTIKDAAHKKPTKTVILTIRVKVA